LYLIKQSFMKSIACLYSSLYVPVKFECQSCLESRLTAHRPRPAARVECHAKWSTCFVMEQSRMTLSDTSAKLLLFSASNFCQLTRSWTPHSHSLSLELGEVRRIQNPIATLFRIVCTYWNTSHQIIKSVKCIRQNAQNCTLILYLINQAPIVTAFGDRHRPPWFALFFLDQSLRIPSMVKSWARTSTGWHKKLAHFVLYTLTLSNIDRFSNLFHCLN